MNKRHNELVICHGSYSGQNSFYFSIILPSSSERTRQVSSLMVLEVAMVQLETKQLVKTGKDKKNRS
jgi:hypothetical protein